MRMRLCQILMGALVLVMAGAATVGADDSAAPEPDDEQERVLTGKGRVLVMDDEEIVREAVGEMLTHLGYEVDSAGDGAEATELFAQARDSGRPFDVVVTDVKMPGLYRSSRPC